MQRFLTSLCGVILSVGVAPATVAAAQPGRRSLPEDAYSYRYFKDQRPLKLDKTRIAVLSAPEEHGAAAKPDLSQYGLAASAVPAMAVRGWWFVETTASVRTDDAIERAARRIAAGHTVDFVSPVFLDDRGEPLLITPHILVQLDRRLDPSLAESIIAASGAGAIVDRDWANMKRAYRLKSASRDGFEVLKAANDLARRSEVTFAEPDIMATGHMALIPNDTYFWQLWGLHNDGTSLPVPCMLPDFDMDAPEAWDITVGDPSIIVAVLDSGVQLDHPDLNLRTPGFDATGVRSGGGGPVNACDNHGTPVAGCVSGIINNSLGIVGVAPGVKTAPVRVLVSSLACDGSATIASSWPVDGLAWAESIGARITNSSWYRNVPSSAIDQKFADTRWPPPPSTANGMVHFGAAGNLASDTILYPARLPSVNAVAGLHPCGGRAPFSNYGVGLDFSAPAYTTSTDRTGSDGFNDGINDGVCLPSGVSTCNTNADCPAGNTCVLVSTDYALVAGTSFASPYAAGVAALALSVNPDLSADQVEAVLRLSAADLDPPGYDTDYGCGFVNAFSAVQLALSTPGEAEGLLVTSADSMTGNLSLSYLPACGSQSHDIYYGPLDQISTYGWSGSTCGIGTTGQYAGFNPGPGSYFFVLVANAGAVEGSYGTDSMGAQRPAAGSLYCGRTQLSGSMCP
jgi:subtilisin family serine protease